MIGLITAFLGTVGLAFLYFIGAIPAGVALGLPAPVAGIAAWLGYSCGGLVIALVGAPLRGYLTKRFRIQTTPDPSKLFWRVWSRYGLTGLSLLAPVTIGPQIAALVGLSLGVPPVRLTAAIAAGVLPWAIAIAALLATGARVLEK